MKDYLVSEKKNGWWGGQPLLSEILGQADLVGPKMPIFSRYLLIVPQWLHLAKNVQLTLVGSLLCVFK